MAIIYTRDVLLEAVDSNLTVQITMTGSPVAGSDIDSTNGFWVVRHPSNSTTCWYFATGSGSSVGFPLEDSGKSLLPVENLSYVSFFGTAGQIVCVAKA